MCIVTDCDFSVAEKNTTYIAGFPLPKLPPENLAYPLTTPTNWHVPPIPILPPKINRFCNFQVVFGDFGQNVWETLPSTRRLTK